MARKYRKRRSGGARKGTRTRTSRTRTRSRRRGLGSRGGMSIKARAKSAFVGRELIEHLWTGAEATALYLLVPTVLRVDGPAGMALGSASIMTAGILQNNKKLQAYALAFPLLHLGYVFGNPFIKKVAQVYVWRWDAAPVTTPSLGGFARHRQTGESLRMMTPRDTPALNSYIPSGSPYVKDSGQLSAPVTEAPYRARIPHSSGLRALVG